MNKPFQIGTEIVLRYFCAFLVGLLFMVMTARFMNHLGMAGGLLFELMAILMFIEVPIWMLLVRFFRLRMSSQLSEFVSAGMVSILAIQPYFFPTYWDRVRLPFVDSSTKNDMLIWYVSWTSNFTIAMLTVFVFLFLSRVFRR